MSQQMQRTVGLSALDWKLFSVLLLSSGLSGSLCVLVSLGIAVGIPISANYSGSLLEQQLRAWGLLSSDDGFYSGDGPSRLALDDAFNVVATFVLWALFGLAVYSAIIGIVAAVRRIKEARTESGYVNVSHRRYLAAAAFQLSVRFGVLTIWFFYLKFFFSVVLKNCLYWLYTSAHVPLSVGSASAVILAFLVMAVALHVHVVLLRLLLLKPRIFGYQEYL